MDFDKKKGIQFAKISILKDAILLINKKDEIKISSYEDCAL